MLALMCHRIYYKSPFSKDPGLFRSIPPLLRSNTAGAFYYKSPTRNLEHLQSWADTEDKTMSASGTKGS